MMIRENNLTHTLKVLHYVLKVLHYVLKVGCNFGLNHHQIPPKMALKNYTTQISAGKTVGELQMLLAQAGCDKITIDFTNKQPTAITFRLKMGVKLMPQFMWVSLPCRADGVLRVLKLDSKVQSKYCTAEQALRTGWRNVKDWLAAQMALIAAGQAELAEIFLPFALTDTGKLLYENIASRPIEDSPLLLTLGQ